MSAAEKKKSENNFRCALIYKKNIERKTFIGFQLQLNIVSVSHRLLALHGNIYPTSTGDMILFSCSPLYDRDNSHILQSSSEQTQNKNDFISFHSCFVSQSKIIRIFLWKHLFHPCMQKRSVLVYSEWRFSLNNFRCSITENHNRCGLKTIKAKMNIKFYKHWSGVQG